MSKVLSQADFQHIDHLQANLRFREASDILENFAGRAIQSGDDWFVNIYNQFHLYTRLPGYASQLEDFLERAINFGPNSAFIANALSYYAQSLRVNPGDRKVHNLAAAIFFRQGQWNEAVKHYEQSLRIKPDQITAMNNISWICSTKLNDPNKARELALQACALGKYQEPAALDTLAIAYAASGRFDLARATAESALALDPPAGAADAIRNRLDLYRQNRPFTSE